MVVSLGLCLAVTLTFVAVCPLAPWGREGYLSLIAGSQVAWHRLANERTSRMPTAHPHTPSSSSRTKLYSGHKARDPPRHLKHKQFYISHLPQLIFRTKKKYIKALRLSETSFSAIFSPNLSSYIHTTVCEKSLLCSPKLHLFDQTYSKNSNMVKHYSN